MISDLKFEFESKFCEKLKIFMTAVLSEISDFDQLFKTFISDLWMNCNSQNGILECSYVDLNDFWKFEVESKFCEKLKIFMTAVLSKFQILTNFSRLSFQTCEWIASLKMAFLEMFFCEKIENFHDVLSDLNQLFKISDL